MVRLRLDLNDIADAPESIPPGKYLAKVEEIVEEESQSGKPKLVWEWEILEGENKGRKMRSHTSLQEHALFGLKDHLTAFGMGGSVDFDTRELIGKRANIIVGKKRIKDRDTGERVEITQVTDVKPAGKSGGNPVKISRDDEDGEGEDIPY